MDDLIKVIRELGIPVALVVYLLWREDRLFNEFTKALNGLKDVVKELVIKSEVK